MTNDQLNQSKKINALKIAITGAAGQIAYSLIPHLINGSIFGYKTSVDLSLIDIPPMEKRLQGVKMEIEDCKSTLVRSIQCTSSMEEGFTQVDYAILLGGFPRKQGMKRGDLLDKNRPIFETAGKALSKVGNRNVKVLVVANPANTNALVLLRHSNLNPKNVTALTRLDLNRAESHLSSQLNVDSESIRNLHIWGNHSSTQVADFREVEINGERTKIELDQEEFVKFVATRGAEVISARGLSSAMSAAVAIKGHLHDWHNGSEKSVAMAVLSDGNPFGIQDGIFFSFPLCVSEGSWSFNEKATAPAPESFLGRKLKVTENELIAEREESLGDVKKAME